MGGMCLSGWEGRKGCLGKRTVSLNTIGQIGCAWHQLFCHYLTNKQRNFFKAISFSNIVHPVLKCLCWLDCQGQSRNGHCLPIRAGLLIDLLKLFEKQILDAPSRNKLSSVVDVPFISVEWTSLKHRTKKLRAGIAETNGVPGNANKPGLEWDSCTCQKGGILVFAVVPWWIVPFARCLVRPGLVKHRRMQERVLVQQVVWDETAHPLPFRGVSSSVVAGRWHLLAVQT